MFSFPDKKKAAVLILLKTAAFFMPENRTYFTNAFFKKSRSSSG